ncbi:cupin domain-containing protein [Deinococcus ruber]|nr:cupin domain-containing protein [Deinococcus ruber]
MNAHQVPFAAALDALTAQQRFAEVFVRGSLKVELYAPRGTDAQTPHLQDEVYIVQQGSGTYLCAGDHQRFGPGDLLFAAAGVQHRFLEFTDDLAVWVVFYGPDGGEQASTRTVMGQPHHEAQL